MLSRGLMDTLHWAAGKMINGRVKTAFLAILALLLFACGPAQTTGENLNASPALPTEMATRQAALPTEPPASTPESGGNLAGTSWELVSMGEPGKETQVVAGSEVTLAFETGGQAGGSAGCNSYSGQYQASENTIEFSEVISTLMACAGEQVNAQESRYLAALRTSGEYEISGDQLKIFYANGAEVLNFRAADSPG